MMRPGLPTHKDFRLRFFPLRKRQYRKSFCVRRIKRRRSKLGCLWLKLWYFFKRTLPAVFLIRTGWKDGGNWSDRAIGSRTRGAVCSPIRFNPSFKFHPYERWHVCLVVWHRPLQFSWGKWIKIVQKMV